MITADFWYQTKNLGTQLHGHLECIDIDDAMEAVQKMMDWCSFCGFIFKRCDINDISSIKEGSDED